MGNETERKRSFANKIAELLFLCYKAAEGVNLQGLRV